MFLVNSRYPLLSATPLGSRREDVHLPRAHLLPKLRCQFAEFLNQGSLKRLGILYLPTCVGLRYGHSMDSVAGLFLEAASRSVDLAPGVGASPSLLTLGVRAFVALAASYPDGLRGWTGISSSRRTLRSSSSLHVNISPNGAGMLACLPSPTPFGLGLGPD